MIKPLEPNIVIKQIKEKTKTESGIILPDAPHKELSKGKVVSIYEGCNLDIKVGSTVLYKSFGGFPIEDEGKEFIMVDQQDLVARL